MDISYLKNSILQSNKIEIILKKIGCHHIQFHASSSDSYYTCANKDGDNPTAIVVYVNSNIKCINHTRNINSKKDSYDIIDLVMFNEKISFFKALKLLCDITGIDYYSMENDEEIPESIKLVKMISEITSKNNNEYYDDVKLQPKSEKILTYYHKTVNDMFKNDGISYKTQLRFEVGYDCEENLITIPIRDEIGVLVGVKARVPVKESLQKYTYLIRCPRGKVLYNLFRSYECIIEKGFVIVVESEKAVMQLYDMGIENVVALSGSKLTTAQRQKLTNLHVDIIFALDKDIKKEDIEFMANKFPLGYNLYAIIDTGNILDEKESPSDNQEKWQILFHNYMVKL